MVDLHQSHNPEPSAGIDTLGWLFSAFAVVILVVGALIAYEATDMRAANAPVSHVVAR
jgi:hypothetical protein